jgi:hypothetical protein
MKTGALGNRQDAASRRGSLARIGVGVGLAVIVLAGCQFSSERFRAKVTRNQELTAGLADITGLEVSTNVGTLRLEAADVPEARIVAAIKVKARTEEQARQWAGQVTIAAEPRGQTLVIKTERPSGLRQNQLSVDFTITAPARLALDCTTNVGDIHTTGFTERVNGRTNVGAIACTGLRGPVELRTDVGDIRAEYVGDAPPVLTASASTNVGSIEFRGPEQISARLTATADVGSIDADRPLTVVGSMKHAVNATLGEGEGRVKLSTNVGSIRISGPAAP